MLVTKEHVRFKASRSHKPGGESRDHRATKVHLWAKVDDLPLDSKQKRFVRQKLEHHINHDDEIWIECQEERSQEENRDIALKRLNQMVEDALKTPPPRLPTEPPRSAENERIRDKKIQSMKKRARREAHDPENV